MFLLIFLDLYLNINTILFKLGHFIGMNMDTDELTHGAFFSSLKGNDTMIITNSVFEDINITKNFPMIEGISYSME